MRRRLVARLLTFGLCLGVLTLGTGRPAEAATITVTNTNDDLEPGSLRWAIQQAATGDMITFDIPGCPCNIRLDSELVIDKHLTINGPGATSLRITVNFDSRSRIFTVDADVVAEISNLQMSGGQSTEAGGIIQNFGTLTLRNSVVANGVSKGSGGGIYSSGSLTVRNSHIVNNGSTNGAGGISVGAGSLTVIGSRISGNRTNASGGGIQVSEQSRGAIIIGSTISHNIADFHGGGLYGTATFVNSTISGNQARRGGGVAKNHAEPLTLINTTVTGNTATESSPQGVSGGGIVFISPSNPVVLTNTIVMGNVPDDVPVPATSNNSLIGGDAATVLSPLADNGGPTQTHALVPNSPAIGAGDNTLLPADTLDLDGDGNTTEPVPVDQRGLGFPRIAGFTVDIGAVELVCAAIVVTRPPPPPPPTVGVPYTETLNASGGEAPHNFSTTDPLPPGLALSQTGTLTGTPKAAGTYNVTVSATDANGCAGTLTYTLTITDPSCGIVIGPATLKTPYLSTLYYQPLSVTPSGQYVVTVSAGELPHGVYLFAIGRSWFLGGIPTKPGEYTFTLAATKANSPCAPTRTYTVIVPATVLPQLTCVAKTGGKQYTAHFGYDNSTDAPVVIPVGSNNYFTPGAQNRGQVTTFQKGRVTNAFSVVFTVKNNHTDLALWYLRGPDNVRRPVNITTATSRCP